MMSIFSDAGTAILKLPFVSVVVPVFDVLPDTDALLIGDPSSLSVTLPVITLLCEKANCDEQHSSEIKTTTSKSFFAIMITCRY
jgi:hypothetical protein